MESPKKQILKISSLIFVIFVIFLILYSYIGSGSEKKASTASIMQVSDQIAKLISVNQKESGSYGSTMLPLPYTGCSLPGSYLDDKEIQNAFNRISNNRPDVVKCVSDGVDQQVRSWAISIKISEDKYWCVDESGDRVSISKHVTTSKCR